jgi:uncharacterized protein YegP (UPF0339 family)
MKILAASALLLVVSLHSMAGMASASTTHGVELLRKNSQIISSISRPRPGPIPKASHFSFKRTLKSSNARTITSGITEAESVATQSEGTIRVTRPAPAFTAAAEQRRAAPG